MDPLNKKYEDITANINDIRQRYKNKLAEWHQHNKEIIPQWYTTMITDYPLLSYQHRKTLTFFKHIVEEIKCQSCNGIYNFGLYDTHCDTCLDTYICPGVNDCIYKINKKGNRVSTCIHYNFATLIENSNRWDYKGNYPNRPEFYRPSSGTNHKFICKVCPHTVNAKNI